MLLQKTFLSHSGLGVFSFKYLFHFRSISIILGCKYLSFQNDIYFKIFWYYRIIYVTIADSFSSVNETYLFLSELNLKTKPFRFSSYCK